MDRVVLKGVGELVRTRQIIHGDHIEVISQLGNAKDRSANATEPVYGNFRLSHSGASRAALSYSLD